MGDEVTVFIITESLGDYWGNKHGCLFTNLAVPDLRQ